MRPKISYIHRLINKHFWYHQAGAMVPFTGGYPMFACVRFTARYKKIPVYYKDMCGFIQHDHSRWYFDKKCMAKISDFYIKKGRIWLEALFNNWIKRDTKEFIKVWRRQWFTDFRQLSDQELIDNFNKFSQVYLSWWRESIFLDAFDCEVGRIIKDALQKYELTLTDREIQILTTPSGPSTLQEQRLDLLIVAKNVLGKVSSFKLVKRNDFASWSKKFTHLAKSLAKHVGDYFWIRGDYVQCPVLDESYFFGLLRELVINKNLLQQEIKIKNEILNHVREKKTIVKRRKLSKKILNFFDFLALLIKWRDLRKKYNIIANYLLLNKYLSELYRRTKVHKNLLKHLYWWEFEKFIEKPNHYLSILKSRYKGRFLFMSTIPPYEYTNQEGRKLLVKMEKRLKSMHSDIRGILAYPGKVRGMVKIIFSTIDFHKMKKGDILVAPNTRPEYVPVMKLASAIITDEGGITSHAAIIARELKVPCIVGCQIATLSLEDGERIELDANHGVIKKI